jgi:hypothetical protein
MGGIQLPAAVESFPPKPESSERRNAQLRGSGIQ